MQNLRFSKFCESAVKYHRIVKYQTQIFFTHYIEVNQNMTGC